MDNKVAVAIAAVIALLLVGGVIAVIISGMGSNEGSEEVTYNGNGGTDSQGQSTVKSKMTEAIPNLFTNGEKKFTHWNTKADGSGKSFDVGENVTMGMTLYAQWADHKLTITNVGYVLTGLGVYLTDDTHSMAKQTTFEFALSDSGAAVISFAFWDSVTVDPVTGLFSGKISGWDCSLKFTITGANDIEYSVSTDGKVANIAFNYTGNVVFS
jgi:hypothetical protein